MTRIFMTGLEAGSLEVFTSQTGTYHSISSSQQRTGRYSLYCASSAFGSYFMSASLPGSPTEIFLRCALRPESWGDAAQTIFELASSSGTQLTLDRYRDTGVIRLWRGDRLGTKLLDLPILPTNIWTCLEMHVICHSVTGHVEVLYDGNSVGVFDGNTQAVSNNRLDYWRIGNSFGNIYTGPMQGYYDDLAVNDVNGTRNNSWIGRGGIHGLVPNGVGTYSELTPSAGDNWECVDETPPNDDTDYVESDTVNHRDLYTHTDLPLDGTISAVQHIIRAKLSADGEGGIARLIRANDVDYLGTDRNLSTSYRYFLDIIERHPSGVSWTLENIAALESGVQVR